MAVGVRTTFPNPNTWLSFDFFWCTVHRRQLNHDMPNDNQVDLEDEEDLIIQAAATAVIAAGLAAIEYSWSYYDKTPYHDSVLMETLSSNIANVHESIRDLATERRISRLQSQAAQEDMASSSKLGDEAMQRLQLVESHLAP